MPFPTQIEDDTNTVYLEKLKQPQAVRPSTRLDDHSSCLRHQVVPTGWPTLLNSRLAWDGRTIRNEDHYTYFLNSGEVAEIEAALAHFKRLGLDGRETNKANFPLPTLAGKLQALSDDLHYGRGFFALRGLDPDKFSREDNIVIFLGVSSYVGEMRGKQNESGHIFAHIRNAQYMEGTQQERPIRDSNVASEFHTDLFCDILAMQTRSCSSQGGNHIVASVATVYNELVKTQPDLIPVLAAPNWAFDTRGKLTPPSVRPLLFHHEGQVIMSLAPEALKGIPSIPRTQSTPCLTEIQQEALAVVQDIAQSHQRALTMRPGDLTFVNNLAILHAREAFVDSRTQWRYLVRMWLKNAELAWSLPQELAEGNRRVFSDAATGLHDGDPIQEEWNIVYKPRLQFTPAERLSP